MVGESRYFVTEHSNDCEMNLSLFICLDTGMSGPDMDAVGTGTDTSSLGETRTETGTSMDEPDTGASDTDTGASEPDTGEAMGDKDDADAEPAPDHMDVSGVSHII